jgi:hypothetical protein
MYVLFGGITVGLGETGSKEGVSSDGDGKTVCVSVIFGVAKGVITAVKEGCSVCLTHDANIKIRSI